ncbi:cell wall surface anchor protein [Bacilli bacterium]|nr:cell wall surface anchor protein [Bacilli bacterium]GHU42683.1 cell wall surface anchor protein [Bacilli bacterium]
MKKLKKVLVLIGLIVTFGGMRQAVSANEFNFSVTPVRPENQIGDSGYFNLQMAPGQSQVLTVTLTNSTEKTVVVEESIASATTNINGVIEYSPNKIKADKSLKYNISDYAKMPAEITLTPKSTQQVKVEVTMPNEPFSGVIAGGITFKEKGSDEANSKSKGISIQNKYAYVVALLMQQDPTPVAPDLKLMSVVPGQVNYRNVVNANLQNPNAGYLNQMYVQATVKGLSNTKLSYSVDKEMMQMAPNTNFDYPISIGEGKRIEAGKYQLEMTVYGQKSDNGKYTYKDAQGKEQKFDYQWQFTKEFTISGQTAKKLNAKDVTIKPEPWYKNWLIWAGIILVLLALFFLFFLLWKRRKDDEEDETEGTETETLQSQIEAIKEQLKD